MGSHSVVQLLARKSDLGQYPRNDDHPLLIAVRERHKKCGGVILEYLEPSETASLTFAPLYHSITQNQWAITQLLLDAGASPNPPLGADSWTIPPMHHGISSNNLEMIKLLLQFNAAADEPDPNTGHTEIVCCLLESKPDVNKCSITGGSPLHEAATHGNVEITKLLLDSEKGADINATCEEGSPLYLASANNQVEVVKVLLGHDPKPDLYYERRTINPLDLAISKFNPEVVALLLKAGTDVNQNFRGKYSPLACAVDFNLSTKLDWRSPNGFGVTHYLSKQAPVSLIERLINRGVDPELTNPQGGTAIWTAFVVDNHEVMHYLASVVKGLLHYACRLRNREKVRLFVDAGADINLASACWCVTSDDRADECIEILQYLVDKGADVNVPGGYLKYILNNACLLSKPEVIEFLIAQKAEVDVKGSLGRTPAHLVCYRGIEHYQKLNPSDDALTARDHTNRTALHYAVMSGDVDLHPEYQKTYKQLVGDDDTRDMADMIRYLIKEGFDLTATGKSLGQEWTPLDIAIYHAVDEKIKDLLIPSTEDQPLNITQRRPGRKIAIWPAISEICGLYMSCLTCDDFDICFKCQSSRAILHPDHEFSQLNPEYDPEDEEWQIPDRFTKLEPCPELPQKAEVENLGSHDQFDDDDALDFHDSDDDDDDNDDED
ncbi:ankyrin repeat-containing domain protein [Aspergillus crustosus]